MNRPENEQYEKVDSFFYVNRPWCLSEKHDYCPLVISIMAIIILICVCIILLLCLLNKKTDFIRKLFGQQCKRRKSAAVRIKRMPLVPIPNTNLSSPRPIINNNNECQMPNGNQFNRYNNNNLSFISTDSFRYTTSSGSSVSSTSDRQQQQRTKPIYKHAYLNMMRKNTKKIQTIDEFPPDYNTVVNKLYFNQNLASSSSAIISDVEYIV